MVRLYRGLYLGKHSSLNPAYTADFFRVAFGSGMLGLALMFRGAEPVGFTDWSEDGELLCHIGMSLAAAGDAVGHAGQAVTVPAARGQHLFTRTKRFLMDWARDEGLCGMYSEATAAHPYSQKACLDLGGHEPGFLLGWIPATVSNDAAAEERPKRQSAALFYTKLNDGHEREVYAPPRHHEIIGQTLGARYG